MKSNKILERNRKKFKRTMTVAVPKNKETAEFLDKIMNTKRYYRFGVVFERSPDGKVTCLGTIEDQIREMIKEMKNET